jgi:UDP-N-acetylglucosamine 2-epimerase (non-hydrolysing)
MRSGDWRNPFPEELNRKVAARLSRIHFAPGPGAVANLAAERVRGEVIDTAHNTIADNIRDIPAELPPGIAVPADPFGLVSLHRQELLYNEHGLRAVLQVLRASADRRARLLFVDHPISAAAVDSAGLSGLFDGDRFVRIPRQRYFHFLSLLKRSTCLIHRTVTEHATGLGGSVVLSGGDLSTVRRFLEDPERLRSEPIELDESPSDRIIRCLEERGFLAPSGRASALATGSATIGRAGR